MAKPKPSPATLIGHDGRRAVGMFGLAAVFAAAATFLFFVVASGNFDPVSVLLAAPNMLVGALILIKANWHRIGWLLMLIGMTQLVTTIDLDAAIPGRWTLLIGQFVGLLLFIGYTLLLVLFPDGHLPPNRIARIWALCALGLALLALPAGILVPSFRTEAGLTLDNPIGVALLPDLDVLGFLLVWMALGISLVGLLVRFRYAGPADKNQYKVVMIPFVSLALYMVALAVAYAMFQDRVPEAVWLVPALAYVAIPVCFGVAILRFRLYDIDRIVSRGVTYLLVAAAVATVYILAVLTLPAVLGTEGDLAVAASTLIAAGAFNPVRVRVSRAVEKRFNRARYNGQRELEAFASKLQLSSRFDAVDREIELVVGRTMQPVSLEIWVRE